MTRSIIFCLFLCLTVHCAFSQDEPAAGLKTSIFEAQAKNDLAKAYGHYAAGILYDNDGDLKAATKEYEKALRYDPASSALHLRLSFDYIKLGQYTDAVKQLNSAIKACGEDIAPRFLLAFLYTSMHKFPDATKEYEQILVWNPEDPGTLSALADLYVLQGRLKEAIAVYNKLSKQEAGEPFIRPFLQFNMGILYAKLGNFRAAEYCLRKAITMFERQMDAENSAFSKEAHITHFYLATLYEKEGRRPQAKVHLRRAIRLYADNPEALNYLGYVYAEDGEHLDEAILMIQKALEFEPDNGAYLDSLGWAYFKKGMLKEALENLQRANDLMPDPIISEHLEKVRESVKK